MSDFKYHVIDLDALITNRCVDSSIAKLEQLKFVDLKKFAQLDEKFNGPEPRRNKLEMSCPGKRRAVARIAAEIKRTLKRALCLPLFDLGILSKLPQKHPRDLQCERERRLLTGLDAVLASKLASRERPFNIRQIEGLAVPGKCATNFTRLERTEEIGSSDLERSRSQNGPARPSR